MLSRIRRKNSTNSQSARSAVRSLHRVRSHPSAWHLKISMTQLDTVLKQLHISLWNILIFHWKIFYLHLQSSSASKKWKNANVLRFADLVHRVRRDPSVTLRKFSPDTTGHGLQITKRPAVWYFSIFLFGKYQFLLEVFCLHLESSSASKKWKNLNIVLFADSS